MPSLCFFYFEYISGEYHEKSKGPRNAGEPRAQRKGETGEAENGNEETKEDCRNEDEKVYIEGYADGLPFEEWVGPQSIVNFSKRTSKPVLLSCAKDDYQFGNDPYIVKVLLQERGDVERKRIELIVDCRIE